MREGEKEAKWNTGIIITLRRIGRDMDKFASIEWRLSCKVAFVRRVVDDNALMAVFKSEKTR